MFRQLSDLTPERLAELRRIAEAATPGPWEWRMSKDGRILDLITLDTGYSEEIITRSHINAWLQVNGDLKDFIPAFDPTTALELLDALTADRAEAERWRKKYEALRAGVERVADDLDMAADEAHDNWRITADFNEQGRSIGLEEAEQMVRQLLAEAGGGDQ